MGNLVRFAILFFSICFFSNANSYDKALCRGKFVNPITDICWYCIFPITVGSVPTAYSPLGLPDTMNPISPVQYCTTAYPPYYRTALAVGYWEPDSLVDVTRIPYCMVNMGFTMPMGVNMQQIGGNSGNSGGETAFYHVHWYKYPVVQWLQLIEQASCQSADNFDLSYVSEIDPLWDDDLLNFYLNPEAILFGNPITQLACAADALMVAAGGLPIDELFWCLGSQGSAYPLNGNIQHRFTNVGNAVLMAERMNYKLHRQGLVTDSIGIDYAVCYTQFSAFLPKSRYRYQFTNVVPEPYLCHPYGKTTFFISDAGKDNPATGENFGILNFKKRNCAAS
jgi:conjugal transfer pilus assembly protein TraU